MKTTGKKCMRKMNMTWRGAAIPWMLLYTTFRKSDANSIIRSYQRETALTPDPASVRGETDIGGVERYSRKESPGKGVIAVRLNGGRMPSGISNPPSEIRNTVIRVEEVAKSCGTASWAISEKTEIQLEQVVEPMMGPHRQWRDTSIEPNGFTSFWTPALAG
jgi:hypothetical protein